MGASAISFSSRGESPARATRGLAEAAKRLVKPSGALIFVSGEYATGIESLAARVQDAIGQLPALIAAGHGVLTEKGEVEGETALAAVLWEGGSVTPVGIQASGPELGLSVAEALTLHAQPAASAFVFLRPRGVLPHMLDPLRSLRFATLVGAGTSGEAPVMLLNPGQAPQGTSAGALVLRGITPPTVRASPACRLLTPLARITAARGPMVLEIEGQRALEALSAAASHLKDQPLLFVALAANATEGDDEELPPLLLRGIQGIDPVRQGIVVSEEVRPGMLMAFAVRDAAAARTDLETVTGRLARETAGAAPRFGVYLSCAGRGASLYGSQDVDTRVIRSRFGDLPLAGMHSSFEIAPHAGAPTLQLYTGVLSVFTSPS